MKDCLPIPFGGVLHKGICMHNTFFAFLKPLSLLKGNPLDFLWVFFFKFSSTVQ